MPQIKQMVSRHPYHKTLIKIIDSWGDFCCSPLYRTGRIGFEAADGRIKAVSTGHDIFYTTLLSDIPDASHAEFWERVHRPYDPERPELSMAGARTKQTALHGRCTCKDEISGTGG